MQPGSQDSATPHLMSSCESEIPIPSRRYSHLSDSQTPTLNAKPIVRAIIESCRTGGKDKTGLQVTLYLDLGFNDKGESVLFQGGTNAVSPLPSKSRHDTDVGVAEQEVVSHLYKELNKVGKQGNLHVYWYTGKDQVRLDSILMNRLEEADATYPTDSTVECGGEDSKLSRQVHVDRWAVRNHREWEPGHSVRP
jgi:hypothetical protein